MRSVSYNTLPLSLSGVATPLLRNYNYEHDPNSDRVHGQQGGLAAGPGHVALLSLHRGCVLQQPGLQVRLTRSSHSFSKGLWAKISSIFPRLPLTFLLNFFVQVNNWASQPYHCSQYSDDDSSDDWLVSHFSAWMTSSWGPAPSGQGTTAGAGWPLLPATLRLTSGEARGDKPRDYEVKWLSQDSIDNPRLTGIYTGPHFVQYYPVRRYLPFWSIKSHETTSVHFQLEHLAATFNIALMKNVGWAKS